MAKPQQADCHVFTPRVNDSKPTRTRPAMATLKERFRLTKEGSTKETYHVVLDLKNSGIEFNVGDSIAVFGQNDPLLVQHLLDAMNASGDEIIQDSRTKEMLTLRTFLTHRANLARASSSFLKLFHSCDSPCDKSQLDHLLQKENKALLADYLQKHDPLDLLKEYRDIKLPLQELCNLFSPLLPRFYSAASSLKAHQDEIHLTVALTSFTHAGEKRYGVASHFLCHLAEEGKTPIPVYIQSAHSFTLTKDPHTHVIMIGPGTGVAPFRALMQERLAQGHSGKNWLFFGERNRNTDYFYEEFWTSLTAQDKLRLDLAFSRDQQEKVYVQHKMRENARDLWTWLQEGAHLYVCGDAERMAKDVDAALHKIVEEQGKLSPDEAKAYVKALRTQKRYLLDVY